MHQMVADFYELQKQNLRNQHSYFYVVSIHPELEEHVM